MGFQPTDRSVAPCSKSVPAISGGQSYCQKLQGLAVIKIYTLEESSVERSPLVVVNCVDVEVIRVLIFPLQISIVKTAGTRVDYFG